ncbi:uncharacterized protein LOC142349227 isoform X2 [Convolutriloba macropyga]|uniref:uncharacterized protein LOC142349227 isoform X2 n=1 Tax=Convolutriloba macropyga TaxID=536237 RepID=UPI003F51D68D
MINQSEDNQSKQGNLDSQSEPDKLEDVVVPTGSQPVSSQSGRSISFLLPAASIIPVEQPVISPTYQRLSQLVIYNDVESYTKLGNAELENGNVESALTAFLAAFHRSALLDDKNILKICCLNLGALYISLQKPKKGLNYLLQTSSLGASNEVDFDLNFNFGLAYEALHHTQAAIHHFKIAIRHLDVGDTSRNEVYAEICFKLSKLFKESKLPETAIKYCRKSLACYEALDNKDKVLACHFALADYLIDSGTTNEALISLDACFQILVNGDSKDGKPRALMSMLLRLSESYSHVSDDASSRECCEIGLRLVASSLKNQSLSIAAFKRLAQFRAEFYLRLAHISKKSSFEQALVDYDIAAEIYEQVGLAEETADCYLSMGQIYMRQSLLQNSLSLLTKSLTLVQGSNSECEQRTLQLLYKVYSLLGLDDKAAAALSSCVSVALNRHKNNAASRPSNPDSVTSEVSKNGIQNVPLESASAGLLQLVGELKKVLDKVGSSSTKIGKGKERELKRAIDRSSLYDGTEDGRTESTSLLSPAEGVNERSGVSVLADEESSSSHSTPLLSPHISKELRSVPGAKESSSESELNVKAKRRNGESAAQNYVDSGMRRVSDNGSLIPQGLFVESLSRSGHLRPPQSRSATRNVSSDIQNSQEPQSTESSSSESDGTQVGAGRELYERLERRLQRMQLQEDRREDSSPESSDTITKQPRKFTGNATVKISVRGNPNKPENPRNEATSSSHKTQVAPQGSNGPTRRPRRNSKLRTRQGAKQPIDDEVEEEELEISVAPLVNKSLRDSYRRSPGQRPGSRGTPSKSGLTLRPEQTKALSPTGIKEKLPFLSETMESTLERPLSITATNSNLQHTATTSRNRAGKQHLELTAQSTSDGSSTASLGNSSGTMTIDIADTRRPLSFGTLGRISTLTSRHRTRQDTMLEHTQTSRDSEALRPSLSVRDTSAKSNLPAAFKNVPDKISTPLLRHNTSRGTNVVSGSIGFPSNSKATANKSRACTIL